LWKRRKGRKSRKLSETKENVRGKKKATKVENDGMIKNGETCQTSGVRD